MLQATLSSTAIHDQRALPHQGPEVRKLADRIIDAQVREITEMKRNIARLEARPVPNNAPDLPSYRNKGFRRRPIPTRAQG